MSHLIREMAQTKVVSLDGSYGEGGGQIVRTATACSAITGTPCRISNIRLNRTNPGLRHQHVIGLRALSRLCDATLAGDEIGSTEISFYPGSIKAASLEVGIKTAGSITLALQTLLLPAFFAPGKVRIDFHGGATDTFFSPTIDYHRFVFSRILERLGLGSDMNIVRRGFYPKGGAEMEVGILPAKVSSWKPDGRGTLHKVIIMSGASEILRPRRVAERQAEAAGAKLKYYFNFEVEVNIEYFPAVSAGSTICIAADFEHTTIGVDGLGRRRKMAEAVGEEAADAFLMEYDSGACLDAHAGDQILPFLSFAEGESEFTVSKIHKHTTTNIWVIGHFVDKKIEIESIGTKSAIILQ
jgi:RNA 3'-terminal phosphate cyclase (GTP)